MVIPSTLVTFFTSNTKLLRTLVFLFAGLLSQLSWAITFESSVDRTQVSEGESIVLTVRYNSNVFSGDPDFSPLQQQFDVINTARKNNFQFINGKSESWTIWTIAIIPKRKGNLVIPSLSFKGETSKPIQISVNAVSDAVKNQQKDVFFHTEVDVKTAYVQGQVLYTEKLYFSVPLENSQLGNVEVADAVVQPLGEIKHYRTQLNGLSYDVFERQSLIFPQTSGEMVIPGPIYNGEISNGRWRGGRPIRLSHPPIHLPVLPKPASYPDGTWLPATDIKLDYKWQGDVNKLKVGEPITLELSLTAKGLTSAQLPNLELLKVNNLKFYPDQAQATDNTTDKGVIGKRTQSIAIVPTKSGSITLPEIRIPWWNTQYGKLEYATLPAQRITAVASNLAQQNQITQADIPEQFEVENTAIAPPVTSTAEVNVLWPIATAVISVLWLLTLYMWWQAKRTPTIKEAADFQKPVANLKSIKLACRNNHPEEARSAILIWAQNEWDMPFASLDHVSSYIKDTDLQTALQELDCTLYSQAGNSAWQGEYLWQLLKDYNPNKSVKTATLAPLFPNETVKNG